MDNILAVQLLSGIIGALLVLLSQLIVGTRRKHLKWMEDAHLTLIHSSQEPLSPRILQLHVRYLQIVRKQKKRRQR